MLEFFCTTPYIIYYLDDLVVEKILVLLYLLQKIAQTKGLIFAQLNFASYIGSSGANGVR